MNPQNIDKFLGEAIWFHLLKKRVPLSTDRNKGSKKGMFKLYISKTCFGKVTTNENSCYCFPNGENVFKSKYVTE